MDYLIDTNVFFEILRSIAGEKSNQKEFDLNKIRSSKCYISEITKIEIISVIGKYARGQSKDLCACTRKIKSENPSEDSFVLCQNTYLVPQRKRWSQKRIKKFRKLLQDILTDNSAIWHVSVLPLDGEVLREAEKIIESALKHKFGSLDAVIAGTARKNDLKVVTHDKGFRAALISEEIPIEMSK